MSRAVLEVLQTGPHVSVQDGGRFGLMRYGVPASGPMDRKALMIANAALGNPVGQAGIEVSPGGLTLLCREGPVTLAVAGGGFIVSRNDHRLGSWTRLTLAAGDRLTLRPGPWGSWCCIAVAGRISSRTWLKSASTHTLSGLGGGRLAAGDRLEVTDVRAAAEGAIPCPVWARPRHRLSVVLGPQDHLFAAETLETLVTRRFALTAAFDRMGLRLSGPSLAPQSALGIPSQGVVRGAIQVAGDGVPTILMADHQTTGGYPKIATLVSDDTDALAQLRPGDVVAFRPVTPAQAVATARTRAMTLAAYLHRLRAATPA